ncbi:hypothetical protein FVE85_1315 [Porphyridium purpureum]|uniref:Uncharacterized protein n=1 Tax=Porphyridium purpureum TaxID=35688 RepID=A0A5J4YHX6_PORPP|nr:hypothetical protein FVE85_1315 [Porphyridium purpureum]|eukprot:POR3041..scf251_18
MKSVMVVVLVSALLVLLASAEPALRAPENHLANRSPASMADWLRQRLKQRVGGGAQFQGRRTHAQSRMVVSSVERGDAVSKLGAILPRLFSSLSSWARTSHPAHEALVSMKWMEQDTEMRADVSFRQQYEPNDPVVDICISQDMTCGDPACQRLPGNVCIEINDPDFEFKSTAVLTDCSINGAGFQYLLFKDTNCEMQPEGFEFFQLSPSGTTGCVDFSNDEGMLSIEVKYTGICPPGVDVCESETSTCQDPVCAFFATDVCLGNNQTAYALECKDGDLLDLGFLVWPEPNGCDGAPEDGVLFEDLGVNSSECLVLNDNSSLIFVFNDQCTQLESTTPTAMPTPTSTSTPTPQITMSMGPSNLPEPSPSPTPVCIDAEWMETRGLEKLHASDGVGLLLCLSGMDELPCGTADHVLEVDLPGGTSSALRTYAEVCAERECTTKLGRYNGVLHLDAHKLPSQHGLRLTTVSHRRTRWSAIENRIVVTAQRLQSLRINHALTYLQRRNSAERLE